MRIDFNSTANTLGNCWTAMEKVPYMGIPFQMTHGAATSAYSAYQEKGITSVPRAAFDGFINSQIQITEEDYTGLSDLLPETPLSTDELAKITQKGALPRRHSPGERQLAGALLFPLLGFYKRDKGQDALNDLLRTLGISWEEITDRSLWHSSAFFRSVNQAMVEATGDSEITRKAGYAFADFLAPHESSFVHLLGAFLGIKAALKQFASASKLFSNISQWSFRDNGEDHSITMIFSALKEYKGVEVVDDITFCLNRKGVLETFPRIWNHSRAKVEHPPEKCIHHGNDCCEYNVSWGAEDWRQTYPFIAAGVTVFATGGAICLGLDPLSHALPMFTSGMAMAFATSNYNLRNRLAANAELDRQRQVNSEELIAYHQRIEGNNSTLTEFAERASTHLSGHVLDALARIAAKEVHDDPLNPRTVTATPFFCDISGFTSASEKANENPIKVVNFLNRLFDTMLPIIHKHGGVVDKFIGDNIMAIFFEKDGELPASRRAANAGKEMQRALDEFRAEITAGIPEFKDVKFRIGFSSGDLVAGNLGSPKYMVQFTVIGHIVNMAARTESAAPVGGVAMTEQAYLSGGGSEGFPDAEFYKEIQLKGQEGTTKLYVLNLSK